MLGQKTKSFLVRFLKGFIGGGLATVIVTLQTMPVLMQWSDLKPLSLSILIGFFTGGLMAVEKLLSWQDIQ